MTAEIFVLNFNGKDLLEECLPSILEAAKASTVPCPVTVIDNLSRDGSAEFVRRYFPQAKVMALNTNRVLCAFNEAAAQSRADILILLNNDLKVEKDFIAPLLEVFERHPDAFIAAPQAFTFDRSRYEGSLSKFHFRGGLPGAESRFEGYEAKISTPSVTMQTGFGAYRRDIFLKLGGFDDLYLPGTVEDTDLCFRAWRAGYACYYAPASRVYHKGQATFGRTFGRVRLGAINERNRYLFTWKNIRGGRLWAMHALWFVPRPVLFLLKGRIESLWGLGWALGRLPQALTRRFADHSAARRNDGEILAISRGI